MIKREITSKILDFLKIYPVVSLTGPRQSGKTTLLRAALPDYHYYSLEDPEIRELAIEDPRKFLKFSDKGMIIDEAQRVPELFSYIQGIVDNTQKDGMYVLSGSQNFLLAENISQSLAGRVAVLKLLPFSMKELVNYNIQFDDYENLIYKGFFPRLYDKEIEPEKYYPFYVQTYIERDVKFIRNISSQSAFIRFLKLLAGRCGQVLNISSLASDCGISAITANAWISILEASYIIFLLKPHYKNFNKRLIKSPKVYFSDTGLLCYLLNIGSPDQLSTHYAIGQIFENFIINEFVKYSYNQVIDPSLYFWMEKHKKEIDLLIENIDSLVPIEIKSAKTYNTRLISSLEYWNNLTGNSPENSFLIYGGDKNLPVSGYNIISWRNISWLLSGLYTK